MIFDLEKFNTIYKGNFVENVVWLKSCSSTQDELTEIISSGLSKTSLVGSEELHNARGQFKRPYFTSKGMGLYFSFAYTPSKESSTQHYKLAIAISVARALKDICKVQFSIKFPNDIYIFNKKIAGILIEEKVFNNQRILLIGIAINVNNERMNQQIRDKATSLKIISGNKFSREILLDKILCELDKSLQLLSNFGIDYLREEFQSRSAENLIIKTKEGKLIDCKFQDLTNEGYLKVITTKTNKTLTIHHGLLVDIKEEER